MKFTTLTFLAIVFSSQLGCASRKMAEEPVGPGAPPEASPAASQNEPQQPVSSEKNTDVAGATTAERDTGQDFEALPDGPSVVASVCEEICLKIDKSCSGKSAAFCRASCRDYAAGAEKCPIEIEDALRCQREAEDFLLCSNIAAEKCAPLYREMKSCRDGLVAPKAGRKRRDSSKESMPEGWSSLSFPLFSIAMPQPEVEGEGIRARAEATLGGVRYRVEWLKTQGREPSDARILRWATSYVGNDCQPKLRLHGRFETDGVIHVRFDTVCKDQSEWHGMLHLWPNRGVVASTFLTPDSAGLENPLLEKFLFSFQTLK